MNISSDINSYTLLRMIVCDGEEKYPDITEPISLIDVQKELEYRHKVNFESDKERWVEWFCKVFDSATDEQRSSLEMTLKIKKAEKKFKDSQRGNDQ